MPAGTKGLYYADYLQLDVLLNAQRPLSDHPDELHFIIIHQVHELWFKLAILHLERARIAMQKDELSGATRLIHQVIGIFENSRQTAEHLHSLPPMAFHQFRQLLAPGSGLQSYQFREIEFLAGLRDPRHINWTQRQLATDDQWKQVAKRLEEPSIAETFDKLIERHPVLDIPTLYAMPHDYPELYSLADALSAFDHQLQRWRYSHIHLVQRTIGSGAIGTAGTTHDYLLSTLKWQLFPSLWDARNELTQRVDRGEISVPRHIEPKGEN
jgi:tryptophan 2,3-dioxygenase